MAVKQLLKLFVQRTSLFLATILVIATFTFILMKSVPGDPFQDEKGVPEECIMNLRRFYGLEDPLSVQYARYVQSIFCFDFGFSLKYPTQKVFDIIKDNFTVSVLLGLEALLIAIPCGILMGIIAATQYHRSQDRLVTAIAVLGISIPSFVMASSLQFFFAIYWPIFPVARYGSLLHTILPALAIAIGPACIISRLLRASMVDVLQQHYVQMATAKGLKKHEILTTHVLKNALLPILSYLGPVTTNILIGSFIIERVFALPGLGQWFVTGVLNRDYPVIGGLTIFYSTLLLSIHALIDIINALIDPRIKVSTDATTS